MIDSGSPGRVPEPGYWLTPLRDAKTDLQRAARNAPDEIRDDLSRLRDEVTEILRKVDDGEL